MTHNPDPGGGGVREAFRPTGAPPLYSQDGKGYDAEVHAHYFVAAADWLVTEYDPDQDLAFGWACLGDRQMAELGYVSLAELESTRVPVAFTMNGVPGGTFHAEVERDTDWPQGLSLRDAIDLLDRRQGRE